MVFTGCCCLRSDLLDCRGLRCPLPVLKMEKRLEAMASGTRLVVLATDPVARIDIPLYCRQNGHQCDTTTVEDGALRFEITRA